METRPWPAEPVEGLGLTPAEDDVARRVCGGARLGEVAAARGTSIKTVKAQAGAARRKLGARTLAHLASIYSFASAYSREGR